MNQDNEEQINEQQMKTNEPHSGLGIASFTIAIVSFIISVVLLVFIINAVMDMDTFKNMDLDNPTMDPQEFQEAFEDHPQILTLFMSFLAVGALVLIGAILGIVGLFIKGRRKLFAILGTIFNILGFPVVLIFVSIALAVSQIPLE